MALPKTLKMIAVDPDLHAALKAHALKRGKGIGQLAEELLRRGVGAKKPQPEASAFRPKAQA